MPTAKRKKAIDSGSAGSEEVTRNASVSKKLRSPSKHVSVAIVKRPREMVAKDTLRSKARSEVGEKRGGSAGKEVVKKVKINGKGKPTAVASCGDSSAVSTGDKIIPKRNKQRQLVFADRPGAKDGERMSILVQDGGGRQRSNGALGGPCQGSLKHRPCKKGCISFAFYKVTITPIMCSQSALRGSHALVEIRSPLSLEFGKSSAELYR